MKKFLAMVFLLMGQFLLAQATVNQYQYVMVPTRFKFTTKKDEYRLNTLTKMLLEKYGFKVYFDTDVLPLDIQDSKCEKLYANVESMGSYFATKLQVTLTDCNGILLYKSNTGSSKANEWKVAYTQALREAFKSFETLHYHYQPLEIAQKTETAKVQTTIMNASFEETEVLYAQPISNGYQLVDATPKVVMKILKTSNPQMFTAIKGTITGVLIFKENQWFFEYYQEEKLVSEKINVKF